MQTLADIFGLNVLGFTERTSIHLIPDLRPEYWDEIKKGRVVAIPPRPKTKVSTKIITDQQELDKLINTPDPYDENGRPIIEIWK